MTQCEYFDGMSNSRCCYHAGHGGDHHCSNLDETDRIRWKLAADERQRLLDENDSLRAEVERLRVELHTERGAHHSTAGKVSQHRNEWHRLSERLSAALAAKDEACEIALQWAAHLRDLHGHPRDHTRIVELRSIGKDGGNG